MPHARSYLVFGNKEVDQFSNSRYLRISNTCSWLSEDEYSQLRWCSVANYKIIPRYNLGLSCGIILVVGGLAKTNYLMIIHLGLSCGI